MIYLVTGLPGNGKSYYTVLRAPELLAHPGRTIYNDGIPECQLPWEPCDGSTWYNLPDGSGVVIDEAQKIFRPLPPGAERPRAVRDLETHRHRGFDIWLITQHANLLDSHVRRLVGKHFHVHRPFGLARFNVLAWERVGNPDDYHERKLAVGSHIKLDPKIFRLYKSAEIHTVKRRIPFKLLLIPIVLALMVLLAFVVYRAFKTDPFAEKKKAETVAQVASTTNAATGLRPPQNALRSITPEIADLAHTAPRYAALTAPRVVPVVQACMADLRPNSRGCWCVSQRGTRMEVSTAFCLDVIEKGRPFYDFEAESGSSLQQASMRANRDDSGPLGPAVTPPNQSLLPPSPTPLQTNAASAAHAGALGGGQRSSSALVAGEAPEHSAQ